MLRAESKADRRSVYRGVMSRSRFHKCRGPDDVPRHRISEGHLPHPIASLPEQIPHRAILRLSRHPY